VLHLLSAQLPGSGHNVPGELQPTGALRELRQVLGQAWIQLCSPSAEGNYGYWVHLTWSTLRRGIRPL